MRLRLLQSYVMDSLGQHCLLRPPLAVEIALWHRHMVVRMYTLLTLHCLNIYRQRSTDTHSQKPCQYELQSAVG